MIRSFLTNKLHAVSDALQKIRCALWAFLKQKIFPLAHPLVRVFSPVIAPVFAFVHRHELRLRAWVLMFLWVLLFWMLLQSFASFLLAPAKSPSLKLLPQSNILLKDLNFYQAQDVPQGSSRPSTSFASLNIKLLGIVFGDGGKSMAILQPASQPDPLILQQDEWLLDAFKLAEIDPVFVVFLGRDGTRHQVDFDPLDPLDALSTNAQASDLELEIQPQISDRERIIDELMAKPENIRNYLSFAIQRTASGVNGIALTPRHPLAQELGIQAGDVLTAVNGVPINDFFTGKVNYRSLFGQNDFSLQMQRNGQNVVVEVQK